MRLYAESIPHLFHWDLAYLWVLEKERHLRPEAWAERVKAWRYLVSLLLTSELEVVEEEINSPFIEFTRPFGLNKVSWVRLRNESENVGVLSPTVLVRPLPDYKRGDLDRWLDHSRHPEQSRPAELAHFLQLAVKDLRENQRPDSFRLRIARCLSAEFGPAEMANPPAGETHRRVPLLKQIGSAQELGEYEVEYLDILVPGQAAGAGAAVFIPRCAACRKPLTRAPGAERVTVEDDQITIDCLDSGCGQTSQFDPSAFLLWRRGEDEVVVWGRQGVFATPAAGFPPPPGLGPSEVTFEWGAAQLGGERTKRFLTFHFPRRMVSTKPIDAVFFKTILVPGQAGLFAGSPVRPEWFDALSNPEQIRPEVDTVSSRVSFRGLQLKGLPMPIDRTFAGMSARFDPALGLGVYPDQDRVPPGWGWFRAFLLGDGRLNYKLAVPKGTLLLPWVVEYEGDRPKVISVTDQGGAVGVSYYRPPARAAFSGAGQADVFLGVDFGTTNTVVYFLPPGQTVSTTQLDRLGLKPSAITELVGWLAEPPGVSTQEFLGDCLPGPMYGASRLDPYIIPSALWQASAELFIRWGPEEPQPGARPVSGFKWDRPGANNADLRRAYLKELLLLCLPVIISRSGIGTTGVKFHLGFSFPLALDHTSRETLKSLLGEVEGLLGRATGFAFESYSINESLACVRAFGTPNPGDTFLVADMGGGTIDLALFAMRPGPDIDIHQIGSVKFAGENYVESLVEKKHTPAPVYEKFRWELKDKISSGQSYKQYGNDLDAQTVLHRFCGLAFEFLRTSVAAHRRRREDGAVNLVLVGNGWHLAEAFSPETAARGHKRVFKEYYSHLASQLGDHALHLFEGDPLPSLPSSKHLVVLGALQNAAGAARRKELSEDMVFSKMPAGRAFRVETTAGRELSFGWDDLVGEDIPLDGVSKDQIVGGRSHFLFDEMPPLTEPWRTYLLNIFRAAGGGSIPYPTENQLRELLHQSVQGLPAKMTKGPLQLILESHWTEYLKK